MIRVNLLSQEQQKFAALQIQAAEALYNRSANLRNPDSKKVKCHQCGFRLSVGELRTHTHNFIAPFEVTFTDVFEQDENGVNTVKIGEKEERVVTPITEGAWQFKGKRKNPHFSARRLQLVLRTRSKMPVFNEADGLDASDITFLMREARVDASRELRAEWRAEAKKKRDQQKLSRAINRAHNR